MSNEKMREEFEIKFPVPFGVEWRDGAYHICKPEKKQITPAGHLFYLGRWEAWQASRAAIEVEMPRDVDQFADDDPGRRAFSLHTNTAYRECRKAIESLGLKVKP